MAEGYVCNGCGAAATLLCPKCVQLGLPKVSAAFCGQACFRAAWAAHKAAHCGPAGKAAKPEWAYCTRRGQGRSETMPRFNWTGDLRPYKCAPPIPSPPPPRLSSPSALPRSPPPPCPARSPPARGDGTPRLPPPPGRFQEPSLTGRSPPRTLSRARIAPPPPPLLPAPAPARASGRSRQDRADAEGPGAHSPAGLRREGVPKGGARVAPAVGPGDPARERGREDAGDVSAGA